MEVGCYSVCAGKLQMGLYLTLEKGVRILVTRRYFLHFCARKLRGSFRIFSNLKQSVLPLIKGYSMLLLLCASRQQD
jgi:hypothetical protein